MKLSEKMSLWGDLKKQIEAIEAEIVDEVMDLEKTQEYNNVRATYGQGRGRYDWQSAAQKIEADEATVKRHSRTVVDWKKVCESESIDEKTKSLFYTSGTPYVKVKLI
jgi:ribosomal protein L14E/L6E/L27E